MKMSFSWIPNKIKNSIISEHKQNICIRFKIYTIYLSFVMLIFIQKLYVVSIRIYKIQTYFMSVKQACFHAEQNQQNPHEDVNQANPHQEPVTLQSINITHKTDKNIEENQQKQEYHIGKMKQIEKLKQQLKQKDMEIEQKNQIIKHLQDRCILVGTYQQKIDRLESKLGLLEKFLDKLEQDQYNSQSVNRKNKKKVQCTTQQNQSILTNSFLSSTKNISSTQNMQQKQTQKRKNILKNKQNITPSQVSQVDRSRQQNNQFKDRIQIVSSKLLRNQKKQEQKYKQIDMKFNKIKETAGSKCRSNKNIQEIYSLLNGNKGKSQIAIKEINNKLENILNQSARLENSLNCSRERQRNVDLDLSFSKNNNSPSPYHYKNQWNVDRGSPCFTDRPKGHYSPLVSNIGLTKMTTQTKNQIKTDRKYTGTNFQQEMFYRPKNLILNTSQIPKPTPYAERMDNSKFNKILNATNVQQMLRVRKYFNEYNTPSEIRSSYNNKSSDFILGSFDRNKYTRR